MTVTYADKVMTDGAQHEINSWMGDYSVYKYYDYTTTIERTIKKGETTPTIDSKNTKINSARDTKITEIATPLFDSNMKGVTKRESGWFSDFNFEPWGVTFYGNGTTTYSRNGKPVASVDFQELLFLLEVLNTGSPKGKTRPNPNQPAKPTVSELIEKVRDIEEEQNAPKEKKEGEKAASDSTQCDVKGGCGTTGHIHVDNAPYHKPGPGKKPEDYPKKTKK